MKLNNVVNSEEDISFSSILNAPYFCDNNYFADTKKTPMLESLATLNELNLDSTKCVIIILPDKTWIYEWFKGDVLAKYIYIFARHQLEKTKFAADGFILKVNEPNGEIIKKDQIIRHYCKTSRLYLVMELTLTDLIFKYNLFSLII